MKSLILFITIFLLTSAQTCKDYPLDYQKDIEVLGQEGIQDIIHCLQDGKNEIQDIINLAQDIAEGNIIGAITKAIQVIKDGISLLEDCKSLFCYGPSFKKCQEENPGNECERWGDVIYPKCDPGFTNWLCCVCASECPENWRDDGLHCAKPEAYGRGVGYPLWDEEKCNLENEDVGGCEKDGALWYPKCQEGFHAVGCCICSPNCPEGWVDIGVSCQKKESYGRGVGYPVSFGLQCLFSKEDNNYIEFGTCQERQVYIGLLGKDLQSKLDSESYQSYEVADILYYQEQYLKTCYENQQ